MKTFSLKSLLVLIISSLPLIYLYLVFDNLPENVPLHFDFKMEPDRIGNKSELWYIILLVMGGSILSYLLISNIHKIDPKMAKEQNNIIIQKIAFFLVIFFAMMSMFIVYSSTIGRMTSLIFILMGVLFAVLGNLMYNIKPNYFIGVRLPWTLNDETNWKKTHRLTGYLWVAGGVFIAILSIILPHKPMFIVFFSVLTIIVLIPTVYSFQMFRKSINSGIGD